MPVSMDAIYKKSYPASISNLMTRRNRQSYKLGRMSTFGERVRRARAHKGLSQGDLGKALGITQSAVSQIENSPAQKSKFVMEIADATGVRVEWLSKEQGEMVWREGILAEMSKEPEDVQAEALTVARALKERRRTT